MNGFDYKWIMTDGDDERMLIKYKDIGEQIIVMISE